MTPREDQEAFHGLIERVKQFNRNAAIYLEERAPFLDTFCPDGELHACFMWDDTLQDYKYKPMRTVDNIGPIPGPSTPTSAI